MGTLVYNSTLDIHFNDRVLQHMQVVIGAKLRRNESFYLNWARESGGRSTIWIHPTIALEYRYDTTVPAVLNRSWLEALTISANTPAGMQLVPEPAMRAEAPLESARR